MSDDAQTEVSDGVVGMDYPEIRFSPDFSEKVLFKRKLWREGEMRRVEFFPGRMMNVMLLSTRSPLLGEVLSRLDGRYPIVLDLEWLAWVRDSPPSLYQLCADEETAYLIRDLGRQANKELGEFLGRNRFIGKGTSSDRQKLLARYGRDFRIDLEDIEVTRLKPYGHSCNFEKMTIEFVGMPSAQFKDKRVSTSNWNQATLSFLQVLYAGFDVVAIYFAWPRFSDGPRATRRGKPR
jgi:hypothetical protein